MFPICSNCHIPVSSTGASTSTFIPNVVPSDNVPLSSDYKSQISFVTPFSVNDYNFPFLSLQNYQPLILSKEPESDQSISTNPIKYSNVSHDAQMVTIRMIMSGKEVGSIIGKKGENIKKIREESGARINISDGSCPERIVTVNGTVEKMYSAFLMMCQKFEDEYVGGINTNKTNLDIACPPVTLRLLVPGTQCGPIIGKGGCKIKEIREMCGASIQVASELLPNSSERSITVSGTANAVARCIKEISSILLETPIKCTTIPYKPKSTYSIIHPTFSTSNNLSSQFPLVTGSHEIMNKYHQNNLSPGLSLYPISSTARLMLNSNIFPPFVHEPVSYNVFPPPIQILSNQHTPVAYSVKHDSLPSAQTCSGSSQFLKEFKITNDMIGCIIGRGGTTINEIRTLSGAQIKISYCDEKSSERQITISGTPDSINTAEMLINANIKSYMNSITSNKNKTISKAQNMEQQPVISYSNCTQMNNCQNVNNTISDISSLPKHRCKLKSCFQFNSNKKPHFSFYSPY